MSNEEVVEQLERVDDIVEEANDLDYDQEHDEPEYTATELKAMEKGWNPDKESIPEGKEWINADEFLRNEQFFNEIHKLKREINMTKRDYEELKKHHLKVAAVEQEKALRMLLQQKERALEDDDHKAVVDIDNKILDIKTKQAQPKQANTGSNNEAFRESYSEWIQENRWYENNAEMRTAADDIGAGYFARNKGNVSPDDLYEYVTKQVKRMYPDEFAVASKSTPRSKATTVESAGRGRGTPRKTGVKFTERDLNDEQRRVMNRFVKTGALTKDEYIKQLVDIGELG